MRAASGTFGRRLRLRNGTARRNSRNCNPNHNRILKRRSRLRVVFSRRGHNRNSRNRIRRSRKHSRCNRRLGRKIRNNWRRCRVLWRRPQIRTRARKPPGDRLGPVCRIPT